ncbi:hypothetical protein [Biformimicrobium ophioploci]|uniref:hypothetical protein n=1 Tax=Biformimicrobium ophioploci TaxID=3036711 RepID=UPI002552AF39|nr:hypothetical protein [Microbulbifer sp. NKW57]
MQRQKVTRLHDKGEIAEGELMDNYVTLLAGIFRGVRFGAASAQVAGGPLRIWRQLSEEVVWGMFKPEYLIPTMSM